MFKRETKFYKRFDFFLVFITIALVAYGLIMINSATATKTGGSFRYLRTQTIAFIAGAIGAAILVFIDYEIYGYFYIPIYVISNLLLVAVLLWGFGEEEWGGSHWLRIGSIIFQPSEPAKFGVIIALAKMIDNNKDKINNFFVLIKVLIFAFIPVGLIVLQGDLGTALVFVFFILVMLFASKLSYKYILPVVGLVVICLVAGYLYLEDETDGFTKLSEDYRLTRIVIFFNPDLDPDDKGLQVIQSKIAIGSGQMYGRGYMKGVQNQYGFVPTKETDFIYAIIVEEMGFIGGMVLIGLYFLLLFRLIKIAKTANDTFGAEIVTGIMGMFLFHILENIGMTMGLLPVTGIPLPFVSYGGTFMLMNMASIGLVLGVGIKRGQGERVSLNGVF